MPFSCILSFSQPNVAFHDSLVLHKNTYVVRIIFDCEGILAYFILNIFEYHNLMNAIKLQLIIQEGVKSKQLHHPLKMCVTVQTSHLAYSLLLQTRVASLNHASAPSHIDDSVKE